MENFQFLLNTAWRDSRKNRGKLIMFMSSIILGIAALVAINSFNENLVKDIDKQASTLIGADIVISSRNRDLPENLLLSLDSIPGEKAREQELFSMAFIPKRGESQFVRIKALEGAFPFYGKLKTEPATAAQTYREKKSILVDDALMLQFDLSPGDSLKLGETNFLIEGRLQSLMSSVNMISRFAPTVYVPATYIEETELIQPGSLISYAYFFKVPESFDANLWKRNHRQYFRDESFRIETILDRKEDLNEAFSSLNYFLNLVALVSLLLGCIGVASSVYIYVKSKLPSIGIFRCLGMKGSDAFMIYFIQIFSLGTIGVIVGGLMGVAIQFLLPMVFADFIPYEVNIGVSWSSFFEGIFIGTIVTILFALTPLVSIRRISPLRTLRASFEEDLVQKDKLKWVIYGSIILSLFLFLWKLTGEFRTGLAFAIGLIISFLVLYMVSKGIIWTVKRFFPRNWNFVLRQGLSNLFRPNNQTQVLLVSIGLGTAVLTTLFIIQGLLLENVSQMGAGNQPNTILYGIDRDQVQGVVEITEDLGLPIVRNLPIVAMRLAAFKGKTRTEWLQDTSRTASRWAINREARVTYKNELDKTEILVKGEFTGVRANPNDSIFVSLADNYAEALDVDIGDELIYNVQGTMITTYVGSIREIEFRNMDARFFIVFPTGVLESAPQSQLLVTKTPNSKVTAAYRNAIVKKYPNVSIIDLGMILVALNDILKKVSYVIQFMAIFCILTGLIVLISSLMLSKYQRIRESVLLRTLGAAKMQILKIGATEYIILGTLSAATGIILAIAGSWALARFQLELDFHFNMLPIIFVLLFVVALTVFIGMLNSREVISKPPLEVLRKEVG